MHRFQAFLRSILAMLCLAGGALSITFAAESGNLGEIARTPDRVAPGELRQGGVFEASVGFNIPDPNVAIEPPSIEMPPFVRLVRQKVDVGEERTRATLRVAFETSRIGHFQGNIRFRGGLYASDIGVDFTVVAPQPGQPRVLILDTPWTHYGVEDASMLQPWLDIVRASGVSADYRWLREADHYEPMPDLSGYHAVLLSGDSLYSLSVAEGEELRKFASDGGRLLVFANRFYVGSVQAANRVLGPAGIRFVDREAKHPAPTDAPPEEAYTFRIGSTNLMKHPLTQGVTNLHAYRASPILLQSTNAQPLVQLPGLTNACLAAVAPIGKGDAVAVGLTIWWGWPIEPGAQGTDTARFLSNLLRARQP